MPKKMILPIAFILMTLFFVGKSFYNNFLGGKAEEEQRQAESIQKIQEKREYDLKLKACIEQRSEYHDELDAKGQLYSIENGQKVDNSFKLLSSACKMMIIRWEKESGIETTKQEANTTDERTKDKGI